MDNTERKTISVTMFHDAVTKCDTKERQKFSVYLSRNVDKYPVAYQLREGMSRYYFTDVIQKAWDAFKNNGVQAKEETVVYDKDIEVVVDSPDCIPTRAHADDIGLDVKVNKLTFVTDDCPEGVASKVIIDTGVRVRPPKGYYVELVPNSRLGRTPFFFGNSFGVIDPSYRGTMKVILSCYKNSGGISISHATQFWKHGKVCGQLILRKAEYANVKVVPSLDETERGEGGFGSTEK